jgi:hypothetical protein
MPAGFIDLNSAFELGLAYSNVEESPYYGRRALKVNGTMMACTPVNKSAEANSVVVAMSFESRTALIKKSPSLYYITDHYAPHPTMLVRLSRISRAELERTLRMAWEFAALRAESPRSPGKPARQLKKPES